MFQHDLSSVALIGYLACLVVAVARPTQKTSSLVAAIVGLLSTVLLLLVAPQDRTSELTSYHESRLPTPMLSITLWLVLVGITVHGRRVSRN